MKKPTQYERERSLYKNKPRKILNLEERVQAIRMYDRTPIYQRVATLFHCSWEQIKNIVSNRDSILNYYAGCQIIDDNDTPKQVRLKKINFLSNVMYEYIKRVNYYKSATITDALLREKARKFLDLIKIDRFYPNRAWIADFKQIYGIDLEKPENILVREKPSQSLKCEDIIAHCTSEVESVRVERDKGTRKQSSTKRERSMLGKLKEGCLDDYYELVDNNGIDADNDADERATDGDEDDSDSGYGKRHRSEDFDANDYLHFSSVFGDEIANKEEIMQDKNDEICNEDVKPPKDEPTEDDSMRDIDDKTYGTINNYTDALTMLRSLEDFAVKEEDFRAINLLSLLSKSYEKSAKSRKWKIN